jgi:hypothetical protein
MKGLNFVVLNSSSYYLSGGDSTKVYLANWSRPGRLLGVKFHTNDSSDIKLTGYENKGFYQGAYLRVIQSNAFLIDEIKPQIGWGPLGNCKLTRFNPAPYFTAAAELSSNSFILRVVQNRQNYLVKFQNQLLGKLLKLERQGEGIFSTDGSLIKSEASNKLFYIYFYRNQFLALDTNLHLLYKGKTRDTVSYARIKVSRISSEHQTTISTPPLVVNKQCTANDRWLFIHSGLKADNETISLHNNAAVIDVYSISDGKYNLSFYLPDFNGEKLTDFRVYGHSLYALYDHYLYKYKLSF